MDKWPQPFWACILAFMGAIVTVVVLFRPSPENIALGVLAVGSNLVSGALGAFAGHALANKNGNTTTTSVAIQGPDNPQPHQ
jgi:hypothetical protein